MNNQNFYTEKSKEPMSLVEAIKAIKPSIVKISVVDKVPERPGDPRNDIGSGSGFFINDEGYILTNNHVIEPFFEAKNPGIYIDLLIPDISDQRGLVGSFSRMPCQIVARDEKRDLALLKIYQNPFKGQVEYIVGGKPLEAFKIPLFCKRKIDDGDRVAVSGYPLSTAALITTSGFIASAWLGSGNYNADMQVNPGNSGGPVYLVETGEIIGVAVSFWNAPLGISNDQGQRVAIPNLKLTYNSGISQVISMENVNEFLKLNNVTIK